MNSKQTEEKINRVFGLYEEFGKADYIGEPVSQIEHMSQAAELAIDDQSSQEVILAAFFHDIGHLVESKGSLDNTENQGTIGSQENTIGHVVSNKESLDNSMGGYGAVSHEEIGAKYLADNGFPASIQEMVRNHVAAKRYLSLMRPGYFDLLSEASKKTLEFQGGPMSLEEARAFEENPLFGAFIKLRSWDEMAKEVGKPLISLDKMKEFARNSIIQEFDGNSVAPFP